MLQDYRQIVAALKGTPWLITHDGMETIMEIVNMRLRGEAFSDEEIRLRLEAAETGDRANGRIEKGGGVGVLSIYGPMFPKSNLMTALSGATSLEEFRSDLNTLMEDDSIKQIVLDMDTPGGSAEMVPETAKVIADASKVKPIYAIANTMSASGGLYLGSQATKFYATDSGLVGSLGVYHVHEDNSKRNEAEGTKITFISAGRYKTAGNSDEPLSDDARAYLQEHVNAIYDDFVATVASGRGTTTEDVLENYGQGKVLNAKQALDVGMIDGIITMENLLGELVDDTNHSEQVTPLSIAVSSMGRTSSSFSIPEGGRDKIESLIESGKLRVKLESVPQEHDDPPNRGDAAPPNTDTPNRALGDEGGEGGSRRDTPPIAKEQTEGGEMDQLETFLRETFCIPEDKDVQEFMQDVHSDLKPVIDLKAETAEKAEFAEKYPEEAAKLEA
jgi:signal peptide peptidase SppA